MSKPQSLASVLAEVIDRHGYRAKIDEVRAVEAWAYIAGPQINRVTERVWVSKRKLHVQLTSSAWRQQLHMQRDDWCRRVNDELGSAVIDVVVFQ